LFGALHDMSSSWVLPMIVLMVAAFVQACIGLGAGRNLTIA
jgi:CP family cyanate transporter-like MFS transporter